MAANHIALSKESFLSLLTALNANTANIAVEAKDAGRSLLEEALFSVKDFKEFKNTFDSMILKSIKPLSLIQDITVEKNLRTDLGLTLETVNKWTAAMNQVLDLYNQLTIRIIDHDFVQLQSVADLLKLIRNKVKPEFLYVMAMIKKWVKEQRGDSLPEEWYEIGDGQTLTEDLGISEFQLKFLPKRITSLAREFKADAKINLSDLDTDSIGDKSMKECADYVLDKAEVTFV